MKGLNKILVVGIVSIFLLGLYFVKDIINYFSDTNPIKIEKSTGIVKINLYNDFIKNKIKNYKGYITEKEFTDLKNQAIRLSQEISGFIKYLKSLS